MRLQSHIDMSSSMLPGNDSCYVSEVDVLDNITHTWTIRAVRMCTEQPGHFVRGERFYGTTSNTEWCLEFYPRGEYDDGWTNEHLCVHLVSKGSTRCVAEVRTTISDALGRMWRNKAEEHVAFTSPNSKWLSPYTPRDELPEAPDDTINVLVEIRVHGKRENIKQVNRRNVSLWRSQQRLVADMRTLLATGHHSDVTVHVTGTRRVFHAHKHILAARSPVFNAMFEHRLTEAIENRIVIEDLDPDVVEALLTFIYTGHMPTYSERLTQQLLSAADKYALPDLKRACAWAIADKLNGENVCQALVLADLHDARQLKSRCMDYLQKHSDVEVTSLAHLKKHHPRLLAEYKVCRLPPILGASKRPDRRPGIA